MGGGIGAVLFGPVVSDGLGAHDRALVAHLHRLGNDAHLDFFSAPGASGSVHGSCERDLSTVVDHAGHHDSGARRPGRAPALAGHRRCGVGFTPLYMRGDQHVMVIDLHQVVGDDRLDRLASQHNRHPIPEAGQADPAALIHPASHAGVAQIRPRGRGLPVRGDRRDGVHDLRVGASGGYREPFGGRVHAQ
jgi:hypothetical protein